MTTTAPPAKVGRVASKTIMHIFTGGLEYKEIVSDLEKVVAEAAQTAGIDAKTVRTKLSMVIIKGETQGYGYVWISDPAVFNLIRGLTAEGAVPSEQAKNPKYSEEPVQITFGKMSIADWADDAPDEPEFIDVPTGPIVSFPERKLNARHREEHRRVLRTTRRFDNYRADQRLIKRGADRTARDAALLERLKYYKEKGWKAGQLLNLKPFDVLRAPLSEEELKAAEPPENFAIVPTPADVSNEEDDELVRPHEIVAREVPDWVTPDQVRREIAYLATTDRTLAVGEGRQKVQKPYPIVSFGPTDQKTRQKICFVRFDPQTRDARFALFLTKAVEVRGTKVHEKATLSFEKARNKAR